MSACKSRMRWKFRRSVSLDCSSYCSELSELFEDATPVWFDGEYVDVELDNVVDLVTVHPDIGNVDFL